MTTREKCRGIVRGYADARESVEIGREALYKRAPGPEPPELPRENMSEEWQLYLEGWDSGIADNVQDAIGKSWVPGADATGVLAVRAGS